MKILRSVLKLMLLENYPKLDFYGPDRDYWAPTKREVEDLFFDTYFEEYKYVKQLFDCDDFALITHAYVCSNESKTKRRR